MTDEEIMNNIEKQNKENEYFKQGFKSGVEYKNRLESKVNELETLLLEFACWFSYSPTPAYEGAV